MLINNTMTDTGFHPTPTNIDGNSRTLADFKGS